MDERIFRTYTSEEVIEALEYIGKNNITEFEFGSEPMINPEDGIVRKIIKPDNFTLVDGTRIFFAVCHMENRIEVDSYLSYFDDSERVIMNIKSETFEGWCPDWDVANIKPVHTRDM